MQRQHEITQKHPLLDENGHVIEAGWSREYLLEYNRDAIQVPQREIKEWEYYLILTKEYGTAFSIANVGNCSRLSLHFLDFANKEYICESDILLKEGAEGIYMPRDVHSNTIFKTDRAYASYEKDGDVTRITVDFKDLTSGNDYKANLVVTTPQTDKAVMVIRTKIPLFSTITTR